MGWFNPTMKQFEEENENITLLGLWWAMYWRMAVLVIGISFVFAILGALVD